MHRERLFAMAIGGVSLGVGLGLAAGRLPSPSAKSFAAGMGCCDRGSRPAGQGSRSSPFRHRFSGSYSLSTQQYRRTLAVDRTIRPRRRYESQDPQETRGTVASARDCRRRQFPPTQAQADRLAGIYRRQRFTSSSSWIMSAANFRIPSAVFSVAMASSFIR